MEQCRCPVCGQPGQEVPAETVRSLAVGGASPMSHG